MTGLKIIEEALKFYAGQRDDENFGETRIQVFSVKPEVLIDTGFRAKQALTEIQKLKEAVDVGLQFAIEEFEDILHPETQATSMMLADCMIDNAEPILGAAKILNEFVGEKDE